MLITVFEFIQLLNSRFGGQTSKNLIHSGRVQGWLEDEDETFSKNPLNRRTAARIVHQFMKIKLNICDEEQINSAEVLKDLYTCRVCANHIAQVFIKGIMDSQETYYEGQTFQIFNHLQELTFEDAEEIISKIEKLNQKKSKLL